MNNRLKFPSQDKDKTLRRYLYQIIHRTVEYGGNYQEITQGISRGCPLSPILGGFYLKTLDDALSQMKGIYYVRYMDDVLIMTKTRWQNRKAIKQMNECFDQLKVEQHPDKTFIGRIEKGFDFLGYHFSREPLRVAAITIKKHVERIIRLYGQQKTRKATSEEMALVLGQYVQRWHRWCRSGLHGSRVDTGSSDALLARYMLLTSFKASRFMSCPREYLYSFGKSLVHSKIFRMS